MSVGAGPAAGDGVRHFLDLTDFSGEELRRVLDASAAIKARRRKGELAAERPLAGKVLGMVFDKPSTRTRVSFDVGMRELGGETIMLTGAEMQLGRGETIADTARVLTFEEHRGPIAGRTVAWSGDANNVLASWVHAAPRLGFSLRIASPPELSPRPELLAFAKGEGANVTVTTDPYEAAAGADAVVTDCWVSMGDEEEGRRHNLLMPYQVTAKVMAAAQDGAIFMHCLPAH